jgi:hypothetical protein
MTDNPLPSKPSVVVGLLALFLFACGPDLAHPSDSLACLNCGDFMCCMAHQCMWTVGGWQPSCEPNHFAVPGPADSPRLKTPPSVEDLRRLLAFYSR